MDINKTRSDTEKERNALNARLEEIAQECQRLEAEEAEITRRLYGLDQILEGLDLMDGGGIPDLEPVGFTDSIRKILNETSVPLLPTQIRELLAIQGHTASSPKNFLISVHTVLTRIEPELRRVKVDGGKTAYISKTAKAKIPPMTPPSRDFMMKAMKRMLEDKAKAKIGEGIGGVPVLTPPPKP